jgi:hypothetical protein
MTAGRGEPAVSGPEVVLQKSAEEVFSRVFQETVS